MHFLSLLALVPNHIDKALVPVYNKLKEGDHVALSEKKRISNDKWIKENYKQVKLSMPNEEAEALDAYCKNYFKNEKEKELWTKAGFIREAIKEKMNPKLTAQAAAQSVGDTAAQTAQDAAGSPVLSLPDDVMEAARAAAQAAGETVEAFIARAVKTQSDRDKITRIL